MKIPQTKIILLTFAFILSYLLYADTTLIGYWKFNNPTTIIDSSLNDWAATNKGAIFTNAGRLNGAYYFNGNSDMKLYAPVLTNLPETIELWVNPTETQPVTLQGYYTIMNNDKPYQGGHGIGLNSNRGLYLNRRGWDTDGWTTGYTVPSNTWTHIAVVLEATQITLYTNGVLYAIWPHSSTKNRARGELFTRVGLRNEGSTDHFKGYMDEIRVWSGVRSSEEIASHFNKDLSPPFPINVIASNGAYTNKVTITWNSSTGATKYIVYRSTTDSTNSASDISGVITNTSFDDITAATCETYYYWVKAGSDLGWSDFSDSDSGYKQLAIPTDISATDGDYTNKVTVTWNASSGAAKYKIYRNTTDTTNGIVDISGEITGTSFDDTTASPCEIYYYRVKAGCDNGWSDFSDSDSGYKRLSIPVSVSASDGGYTDKVTITWDASSGATKFKIYRNTVDNSSSASDISGEITGTSFNDTTANPCETYYYWIKAGCDNGWSDFSDSDSGYKRLSIPVNISASDGGYTNKVTITWDTNSGATKYKVYRNTIDNSSTASDISGEITGTSFDDTTANFCDTYYYWVKAGCDNGWSDFSDSDSGYKRLTIPTDISASDGGYTNKITITWNSSTGATKYKVYRNTVDNSSGASDISGEITGTSFDDIIANAGQIYFYWIKAGCNNGWSDFSDSDSGYAELSVPVNVSATDGIYDDKVIITWSNVPYALAYNIYRSELNIISNATLLGSSVTNNIYIDTAIISGKKYFYWIEATANAGNSDLSESDSGFAFVSQDEPGTKGKWKYKSKNGKAKLIIKDMGMTIPLANYLEDGCLIGLKNASNNETVDGPRALESKKKKNGDVKFWFYNEKKTAVIKYKPKNDKLIYKVWKTLPTEIIFFIQPPADPAQAVSESKNVSEPLIEIHLQPDGKESKGWDRLKPTLIESN